LIESKLGHQQSHCVVCVIYRASSEGSNIR
jgi:hypothetical protein